MCPTKHKRTKVLDVLPEAVREEVEALERESLAVWQATLVEEQLGNMTGAEISDWRREFSQNYMKQLQEKLEGVDFNSTAPCATHGEECPVTPRQVEQYANMLWIDCAGSTCVPWSQAGQRMGQMHSATVVFMTWLLHRRYMEPSLVVHECTPQFPWQTIAELLNSAPRQQLKCIHSPPDNGDELRWVVRSRIVNPVDMGIPASHVLSCPRALCLFGSSSFVELAPSSMHVGVSFEQSASHKATGKNMLEG